MISKIIFWIICLIPVAFVVALVKYMYEAFEVFETLKQVL